jgi:hypothetical protein
LIDKETLEELKGFKSIYGNDKDKSNRLAGLLCENRKKNKL